MSDGAERTDESRETDGEGSDSSGGSGDSAGNDDSPDWFERALVDSDGAADSSGGSVTADSSNGERDDNAPETEEDGTAVDVDWPQDGQPGTAATADEFGPFEGCGDDPLEVDDGSLTTGSDREQPNDDGAIDDTTGDGATEETTDDEGGLFDKDFGSALEGVSEPSMGGEDVGPEGFSELEFGL